MKWVCRPQDLQQCCGLQYLKKGGRGLIFSSSTSTSGPLVPPGERLWHLVTGEVAPAKRDSFNDDEDGLAVMEHPSTGRDDGKDRDGAERW